MEKIFSVGIVTYNSQKEIRNVLNSLERLSNRDEIEIYVIDNHSNDGTVKIVEQNYPDVKLIKNNRNLGFGRANNKAIMKTNTKYYVLVNPDITVTRNTFVQIHRFMEEHPDIVQMSPKVLNEDGTEQFLPKKYPKFKYLIAGKLENKSRYFRKLRSEYTFKDRKIEDVTNVDFCTGCFSVLRTEPLKKCNGFDERFFLYLEDADLTRKMQKFGRTVYNPGIAVYHKWKRASGKSVRYFFIHLQSMTKYCWKWR